MGNSVRLELVVPPLVITCELAFLITVLTVFNVAELLVAYIDLGVLNENVPLNIFSTVAGIRQQTPLSRLCKRRETGTPETGNNACGWPVMSAFDIRYILVDIFRCSHNEVKISQR